MRPLCSPSPCLAFALRFLFALTVTPHPPQDALSGNCRTVMIAHVSPCHVHREETRNTLIYADRAKNISKQVGDLFVFLSYCSFVPYLLRHFSLADKHFLHGYPVPFARLCPSLVLSPTLTALALQVRRNVLDVSYHVSQYQNIISELREEIDRLKGKLEAGQDEGAANGGAPLSQEAREEQEKNAERLKKIKNDLLDLFREQMSLRWVLVLPACLTVWVLLCF